MSKLQDMADAFASITNDMFGGCLVSYTKDNEAEIVNANIEQMRKGLTPEGNEINPAYKSIAYANRKRNNPKYNKYDNPSRPFMVPNLGLTGAFYGGITIEYDTDAVSFTSTDAKWDNMGSTTLHEKYGDVLGVPEWYMTSTFLPGVRDVAIDTIKSILGII